MIDTRINLFGCRIDRLRMPQAVERLYQQIGESSGTCRYVVTPNVDHVVMLEHHDGLRRAYDDASLVLADGMPVVLASRLLGCGLPERVTGADLVVGLFAAAERHGKLRTFLLGAAPGVAERAAAKIESRWPAVEVVGTYCPPLGFERDPAENATILERIAAAQPDVLVVGLGAPKQELWVHQHQHQLAAKVALCVGATIDFLAEHKRRAPLWMQKSGLEWLHRAATEPRRLAGRYARDAWRFPRIVSARVARRPIGSKQSVRGTGQGLKVIARGKIVMRQLKTVPAGESSRGASRRALRVELVRALDLVSEPVLVIDADLRIVHVNATAARGSGYRRAALRGIPLTEVLHDDAGGSLQREVARLLRGETTLARVPARQVAASGALWAVEVELRVADVRGATSLVAVVRSPTAKKQRVRRAAPRDYLTGLPTRSALDARFAPGSTPSPDLAVPLRGAVRRSRRFQAGQRCVGACRRRRRAACHQPAAERQPAARRFRGPIRRRRIRGGRRGPGDEA